MESKLQHIEFMLESMNYLCINVTYSAYILQMTLEKFF